MFSAPVRWTAVIGATAVTLVALWRHHDRGAAQTPHDAVTPASTVQALPQVPAVPPPVMAQPVAAAASAATRPPAMPYSYVGSWREQNRLHLYLRQGQTTFRVDGLGPLDQHYAVVAADEDRVSIQYLPLGTVQVLRREVPQPSALRTAPHAAAGNDSSEAPADN